ncbi:MAG: zinc-binding dehydrogenase [Leptospiraceae bacterium]|nr:zinc-binding dehydrogenase [Leptospiraceae bacterium]
MKAAVLHEEKRELEILDVATPEPGPGEVRVQVCSCGVCGSDVHLVLHRTMRATHYPRIPGHESAGIVDAVGPDVSNFKAGDRVIIAAGTSCGKCKHCLSGRFNLCPQVGVLGFDCDGSYAEQVIAPARLLVPLPESIPFEHGAILADCVSTPYHALKFAGNMQTGERVAIFGCGGLGIHAILLARALGAAHVTAFDVDEGALQNARDFGADAVVDARSVRSVGKELKKLGDVDLICDFSGYYKNITDSLRALTPGGRAVMVGISSGKMDIAIPALMIFKQLRISGSYGCDSRALPELVELIADGKLDLSRSITSTHSLEEVNECLHNLDERNGNPVRYVIDPTA